MAKPILLVEDDSRDLELTMLALERARLAEEVAVARDGAEAMQYLLRQGNYESRTPGNPAVMLLDLKLPKLNGLEVLETVRSTESLSQLPVVMLTSSAQQHDIDESYRLGVNGYVVKRIDFRQYAASIADIGAFWAHLNEPPSASMRSSRSYEDVLQGRRA